MPYIADTLQQTEEEKKKKGDLDQQSDISVSGAPTQITAGVAPTTSQEKASTAGKMGTGMKGTEALKYVKAHQEPKLAEKITGKLKTQEEGLQTKAISEESIAKEKTGFELEGEKIKQIYSPENQATGEIGRVQRIGSQIPRLYEKSATDIQSFMQSPEYKEYLTAKTGGFDLYESQELPQLSREAQTFQEKVGLGTSEKGRFQLLREVFSRPEKLYTTGQQTLDQLLLQSKPSEVGQLSEYAGIAGKDLVQKLSDVEKLQQLARAQTELEMGKVREDVITGAQQAFTGIEENVVNRLRQYNENKNKVTDLYTQLMSGQPISEVDKQFLRQNTTGDVSNRMLNIAENLSYQTEFGKGVEGRWHTDPTASWQTGKQAEEAESFLYNYGALTPEEIRLALATTNIEETLAGKSRFATAEDIAKQQALEALYADEIGSNLVQSDASTLLTPSQVGTDAIGIESLEKLLGERKRKVETAQKEEALEAATTINDWFYNDFGSISGYGNEPTTGRDALAASYKYIDPTNQYSNVSNEELREIMKNDPNITKLYYTEPAYRYGQMVEEATNEYNTLYSMIPSYERPSFENYLYQKIGGAFSNMSKVDSFIDQIIEQRKKVQGETEAREGGYFQQLRQFYGLN